MVDLRRARWNWRRAVALALLPAAAATTPGPLHAGCDVPSSGTATVAAVPAAAALTLESGEKLVLTAIEPPSQAPVPDENWPPRAATRTELDRLANGKAVSIAAPERRVDRYGNRLGQVYVPAAAGADPVWIQGELVAAGLARVAPLEPDEPCIGELLALEAAARADKRGHWGTGIFADHDAGELYTLRRLHDTFQTVVGVVETIDQGHGPPALILRGAAAQPGLDEGFRVETADVKGRQNRQSRSAGLAGLTGHRVRVRGWLEGARRARVTLADPQLIEVID